MADDPRKARALLPGAGRHNYMSDTIALADNAESMYDSNRTRENQDLVEQRSDAVGRGLQDYEGGVSKVGGGRGRAPTPDETAAMIKALRSRK